MNSEIYQYLLQHKKISVPGTGTFLLQRQPALLDFANKLIYSRVYKITLVLDQHVPHRSINNISDEQLKYFAEELKIKLNSGVIEWRADKPLTANRVLREKAEHMVRVGEDERTSVQMEAMLTQEDSRKSYWWAWALSIALLALMFIGWYFSEHGMDPSTSANTRKADIETSAETYK